MSLPFWLMNNVNPLSAGHDFVFSLLQKCVSLKSPSHKSHYALIVIPCFVDFAYNTLRMCCNIVNEPVVVYWLKFTWQVVEIGKGSKVKYELDKTSGLIKVSSFCVCVPWHYEITQLLIKIFLSTASSSVLTNICQEINSIWCNNSMKQIHSSILQNMLLTQHANMKRSCCVYFKINYVGSREFHRTLFVRIWAWLEFFVEDNWKF